MLFVLTFLLKYSILQLDIILRYLRVNDFYELTEEKQMKKFIAFVLVLACCLSVFAACGNKNSGTGDDQISPSALPSDTSEKSKTSTSVADQNMKYGFGVYYIKTADKQHKLSIDGTNTFVLDEEKESRSRFTFQIKERLVKGVLTKFYAIYKGDDTRDTLAVSSFLPQSAKLLLKNGGYAPSDKELWTVEDYKDGTCRIIPMTAHKDMPICLAVKEGKVILSEIDEKDPSQLFAIEKAAPHEKYVEYASDKGNIFIRIDKSIVNKKSTGLTDEMMQDYANFFQEAYEAEIELTGYIPYDLIVISGWEDIDLAAGVSDNYNVITAGKAFMNSEMTKMAARINKLQIYDLSFGMLHEMGHMFDSRRGWNFESEAWTDLKLCYVIHKMTEAHKETDKKVFGCSSADYPESVCHTYETMAEGLDIHAGKGAMTTVYGFFGAARLFLLMAYDFGWEPFIKTFHWYQENGYTQDSFERWERFTTFVEKLSEFSGKDIKKDYLTEENWKVFEDYYTGKTNKVV